MIMISQIIDTNYACQLHKILENAFIPFTEYYTPEAFAATVVSADVFINRISTPAYSVYGAFIDNELHGTVTTKPAVNGDLYFMSMAVDPHFSGRGIGTALLRSIEQEARNKGCPTIRLLTYEPLINAIALYEHFGYTRTGKKVDYSGIEVFEMQLVLF